MKLLHFLELIRIRDWLKNILIFFPLVFSGYLLKFDYYYSLFYGFLVFCIISSSIYVFNDILDVKSDKIHPTKVKEKPLVSGKVNLNESVIILVFLISLSIFLLFNSNFIFFNILLYIFINLAYNLFIKRIPFIEMLLLSFGYVIRIDTGSKIIQLESSLIMLSSTFFLALFFISLKRLGEYNISSGYSDNLFYRNVLKYYNAKILKFIAISSFFILDILILLYIYFNNIYLIFVFFIGTMFLSKYFIMTKNSSLGEFPIKLILKNKLLLSMAIFSLFLTFISYF